MIEKEFVEPMGVKQKNLNLHLQQKRGVVLKNSLEGNDEYYIDETNTGSVYVPTTLYSIRRSQDSSWNAIDRGVVVHTLEDNPTAGKVYLNKKEINYEELSALRELLNYFCVNSNMFNDLYKTESMEDFYSPYANCGKHIGMDLIGDEFIGAPGVEDLKR